MWIYKSGVTSLVFLYRSHFLTLHLTLGLVPLYIHSPLSPVTAMVKFWLGFDQISEGKPGSIFSQIVFCIPLTSCPQASLMLQHEMFTGVWLALTHVLSGNMTMFNAHVITLDQWHLIGSGKCFALLFPRWTVMDTFHSSQKIKWYQAPVNCSND